MAVRFLSVPSRDHKHGTSLELEPEVKKKKKKKDDFLSRMQKHDFIGSRLPNLSHSSPRREEDMLKKDAAPSPNSWRSAREVIIYQDEQRVRRSDSARGQHMMAGGRWGI